MTNSPARFVFVADSNPTFIATSMSVISSNIRLTLSSSLGEHFPTLFSHAFDGFFREAFVDVEGLCSSGVFPFGVLPSAAWMWLTGLAAPVNVAGPLVPRSRVVR